MSRDLTGVSNTAQEFLRRWKEDGRSQCLQHLITITGQPHKSEEVGLIIQSLVNALVISTSFRLSPDDLAELYMDLVRSQPSSSTTPDQLLIHRILLDSVSVVDDVLEDRAAAREALAKEKDQNREPKDAKEKQLPRTIPERQPLVQLVRHLLTNNVITQDFCAVTLDYALLHDIGLLRDASSTSRMEVRARTRLIYRQTKVNLLREQSEGYSKFTIELSSSIGPAQDLVQGVDPEFGAFAVLSSRQTTDRLMKIAGYFDLDPTRMLDLIVDVFSTHLMTHYVFFIHLIRRFTKSRMRLLGEVRQDGMQVDRTRSFTGMDFEDILIATEGDVSEVSSSTELKNPLAQLLGFKFRHYELHGQNPPQNLVFVAAILLREGLLSIRDFYEHLSPDEAGMKALQQKHEDEMKKRIRTVKTTAADKDNALANAPVLSTMDDRDFGSRRPPPPSQPVNPAPVAKVVKEPKILDELNQHRDLAIALLSVGALRPALFILTRHPWLSSRYPQIADIFLRYLELSIDPVYRSLSSGSKDPASSAAYAAPLRPPESSKLPQSKPTTTFPVPPPTKDTRLVFFFQQYAERIPICSSVDDFPCVVGPMLRIIGPHGYRDLSVFIKLCRIGRASRQDQDDIKAKFWKNAIRVHFLPLLSMASDNPLLGIELWPLLEDMEIRERWSIYAEWLHHAYDANLEMQLKKALVTREVKGVLRRLNAKNQGQSARALAKIAHHNPCVVFNIAIGQVMSYDNLADPLMEALRTLTPIGYDVLTFSLLDAFSQPDRPRMKDDGTNVSHWLQSLASFTAHLCRRYNQIDPTPILQFIVHRLHGESPPDAIILRELVSKMSGIEPLQMLADNQVAAMGGGPILQTETVASETRGALQGKPLQRSAEKLFSVMYNANLVLPLLILLAQQSQQCVYGANTNEAVLKGLGSTFDDLRGIFFQYVTFLSLPSVPQRPAAMKMRGDFFTSLPRLDELVNQYGAEPGMVFHMCRTPLQRSIIEQAVMDSQPAKVAAPNKEETSAETEARLRAQVAATRENGIEDILMQVDSNSVQPWLPVLQPWIDAVAQILPPRVNAVMGAPFYVTFWQLTLFETVSLVKLYKEQVTRITKLAEDHARTESSLNSLPSRERLSWVDKKDRLELFKEHLVKESNEHVVIYGATKKRLAQEKLHWFDGVDSKSFSELPRYILQYCLFPRALLTPMDADFAAQFIKILHNLGTKGFWTVRFYSQILGPQLGSVIFSCTQNEARNYGRFLRGILRDLAGWHKDEAAYLTDTKKGTTPSGFAMSPTKSSMAMSWTEFKSYVKNLHKKLGSALVAAISMSNAEFMHVSNSILVLKEILPVFPLAAINAGCGQMLDDSLQRLLAVEKRGDIKLLATSYQGQLRMVKREWVAVSGQASATPEISAGSRTNGHSGRPTPAGPKETPSGTPSGSSAAARTPARSAVPASSMQHPLPANPARSRATDAVNEIKTVERPPVVKRINRELLVSRDAEEAAKSTSSEASSRAGVPRLQVTETPDPSVLNSPRPANGQAIPSIKDVPLGPRNPSQKGHRLSEDPSSRPPPSASMQPPKTPVPTASPQDTRTSTSHQHERMRAPNTLERESYIDNKSMAETKRGDASRANDSTRVEQRRRSRSPNRPAVDSGQDNRRRDEDRGVDRHSTREDPRRPERRSGREDDRERDREKDRRGERDRDRERDSSRRDRDPSARVTASRGDEPNRTPGSPHRADDAAGRKRLRDPGEQDPSDRSSKRPTRERERDKEKDRDRRDRSTRDKDDGHRRRERKREKEDASSANVSPRDTDSKDKDGGKSGPSATPSAPRAMIAPEDKRMISSAFDAARRDREVGDVPPLGRQQSNHPAGHAASSSRASAPRREFRDDRGTDSYGAPSGATLASRIDAGLPPRPAFDQGREGDRSDFEGQRKRTASTRSQEDISGTSSSKRVKIDRGRNR